MSMLYETNFIGDKNYKEKAELLIRLSLMLFLQLGNISVI